MMGNVIGNAQHITLSVFKNDTCKKMGMNSLPDSQLAQHLHRLTYMTATLPF